MEIEELKQQWEKMNIKIAQTELIKRTTSLDLLIRTYRRFSLLAIFCIFGSFSFYKLIQREELNASPAIVVLFIATMALSSGVDYYLYRALKRIDLLTMTVSEVSQRATACRRIHLISQLVLLPMAIIFITLAAIGATTEALRWGLITGAIFGMIVGINVWLRIMRTYRTLTP